MVTFIENEPLSEHTTFALGGKARIFVRIKGDSDVRDVAAWLAQQKVPYFILGGGSNVIAHDAGFDGVIIKMEDRSFEIKGNFVTAAGGSVLAAIAHKVSGLGLSGLEWAGGIPGTLGGAIRGNAGAFGKAISDVLGMVEAVDLERGECVRFQGDELEFSYRMSMFKNKPQLIITHAVLKLIQSDSRLTKETFRRFLLEKQQRQPLGASCAGCIFKNVPITQEMREHDVPIEFLEKGSIPAWYFIEQVNLKNHRCGNAVISPKHANFIINMGGARTRDILELICLTKERVKESFHISLEEEVQYIS